MCYLLKLLVRTFLYHIYVNQNKYVKEINYFVFIIHQGNKHAVSRLWFTEKDAKHFKSGALRTITNITRSTVI